MNKKVSIVFVGNCQARALAKIMESLAPFIDISAIAIVHLLRDADEPNYRRNLESADIICAQRVTDNYPCRFVRSAVLLANYGERVRIWPNLYYRGYNPELIYIRDTTKKLLPGPLGDYHNETFFNAWRGGSSVKDAVRLHQDPAHNGGLYLTVPDDSIRELRIRESETDVEVADWITSNMGMRRLFFTFNHPSYIMLEELARRLLRALGLDVAAHAFGTSACSEPLGQFRCPLNPWIAQRSEFVFDESDLFYGHEVIGLKEGNVINGKPRTYDSYQIAEAYFRVYDARKDSLLM
jgi:hypothetical protein